MSRSLLVGAALAGALLFAVGCASVAGDGGEPDGPTPAAAAAPAEHLYVTSQSGPAVSVIDMASDEVATIVDLRELGFSANAKPHHTAVEPDGSHWYVSLISDGFVLKFDRDNRLVGRAAFETPGLLAVDPVEEVLYIGRSMAAVNPPQRIGRVVRSTMEIDETDVFFPRPHALAVHPSGGLVYTASLAVDQMAALAPAEEEIELVNVPGPGGEYGEEHGHVLVQFAVSPDASTLATGGQMSGQLLVFDISDPWAPELVETTHLGGEPWHPTFSPDGSTLYVPRRTANDVAVVDTATWTVVAEIEGPSLVEPHGSAISPDGRKLYVSARNIDGTWVPERPPAGDWDGPPGSVSVIDTRTREIVKALPVPPYAAGMSTRPR